VAFLHSGGADSEGPWVYSRGVELKIQA